jgi:3-methyladenine DNA glycosylase/8-oxoguanine DNA glycosylase
VTLAFDPVEAVAALSRADRRLAGLIRRVGPCTLAPQKLQSPFEALLRAIVYQQLTGKAAATIFGRLAGLCPRCRPTPAAMLALDDAALRGAGLSRAKVAAVRDLAARALAGEVPGTARLRRLEDEAIVEHLTQIRGIGPWTVQMLLIFRLGRPDVLPVADYGVRNGFRLVYRRPELPTAAELTAHAERWRPYRSVASWYLWRALDKKP